MPLAHEKNVISLQDLSHEYSTRAESFTALDRISLDIQFGQSCAIVGDSGSGKSTLLNIIGLLDPPTCGDYFLSGERVSNLSDDDRAIIRNRSIGFIFQGFHLLPRLTVLENVALPLLYRGISRSAARIEALECLDKVGLSDRKNHLPADISGGQRQRVAIARALVGRPTLILADEPTGNLDPGNANSVLSLMLDLNRIDGVTLVLVTHDLALAKQLNRLVRMTNGKIVEDTQGIADVKYG